MRHADRNRDERGAALILVAIMLTAMLAVAGLVLDGSFGYTNHRQMQNAADASALAGARTLQLIRFSGSTRSIHDDAQSQATKNGSATDAASFDCRVLTLAQSRLDPPPAIGSLDSCSSVTAGNAFNYVGVMVKAGESHTTFLGGFTNQATQRTTGIAAASIQVGISAGPWMICGTAASGGWDFLDGGVMRSDAELAARYGVNQDWPTIIPVGGHGSGLSDINGTWAMAIHSSQTSAKDCGIQGSGWKGLINPADLPLQALPKVVRSDVGEQVGHYKYNDVLARTDGCPSQPGSGTPSVGTAYNDCLILIPVFDQVIPSPPPLKDRTRLVDVAVFRVFHSGTGNIKYYAQFVCHSTCSLRGGATTDDLSDGGIPVVKLIL